MNSSATDTNSGNSGKLPVFAVQAPDYENLNMRLRSYLVNMAATVPDRGSNQANGQSYFDNKWLSDAQLHTRNNNDVQALVTFAQGAANRIFHLPEPGHTMSIKSMWAMVSKTGLTGVRHNHAGRVSAAYYVDVGSSGESDGGLMQFFQHPEQEQPTHRFRPESGQLLLFPSVLQHSVSCYSGADPRIVIALNLV